MVNQEYERAEKQINENYLQKGNRLVRKGLIGFGIVVLPSLGFMGYGFTKYLLLERDFPAYQEFQDNKNSLSYLRNQLSQYVNGLPEYLSPEIKKNLESITVVDSSKISALEKSIEIAKNDSSRIVNIPEYNEFDHELQNARNYSGLGILPALLSIIPVGWVSIMQSVYKRKKRKEIKSLKESYGIKE